MSGASINMEGVESAFVLRMLRRANMRKLAMNKSAADIQQKSAVLDTMNNQPDNRRFSTGFLAKNSCNLSTGKRTYSGDRVNPNENIPRETKKYTKETDFYSRGINDGTNYTKNFKNTEGVRDSSFYDAEEFNKDVSITSKKSSEYETFKWRRPHFGGSYQVKSRNLDDSSLLEETINSQLGKRFDLSFEAPKKPKTEPENATDIKVRQEKNVEPCADSYFDMKRASSVTELEKIPKNELREQLEMSIDYTNRSMTSIARAIEEIDRELKYLEAQREEFSKKKTGKNKENSPAVPKSSGHLPNSNNDPGKQEQWSSNRLERFNDNLRQNDSFADDSRDNLFETGRSMAHVATENKYQEPSIDYSQEFFDTDFDEVDKSEGEMINESVDGSSDISVLVGGSRFAKKFARRYAAMKKSKGHKLLPNLESTRRSSKNDLSRKGSLLNMESTISSITTFATHMTSESMDDTGRSVDKYQYFNSSIPPEVERFLEDALGDELNNSSVTFALADERDKTSEYTASDYISDVESMDKKRSGKTGSHKRHGTLDKTRTLYRSFAEKLKKKLQSQLAVQRNVISHPIVLPKEGHDKMQKLLQELDIQQTLLYQASKALNLCYAIKNFTAGPEHVESERLLLLTDLKKKAILEEIRGITGHNTCTDSDRERGELIIKDIILPLKNTTLDSFGAIEDASEWFVVTVSQGAFVWASQAIPRRPKETDIEFPESMSIPGLAPDFKIDIKIYSLQLREPAATAKCPRKTISQWKASYSSMKKMWKKSAKQSPSKETEFLCSSVRNTSFVLAGCLDLTLDDVQQCSPWALSSLQPNSTLKGIIELNLSCKLHISVTHAGFLTHGDESPGGFTTWNRRWCVLEGHTLKFWNYPQEQGSKDAQRRINLVNCVSKEVAMIDRRYCAKPRTMVIKTERLRQPNDRESLLMEVKQDRTIIRNLLSCDTVEDLVEWTTKLNHVISVLREWKATSSDDAIQVSGL